MSNLGAPPTSELSASELTSELIEDSNSSDLDAYQALMERTFPPEELDSKEVTVGALKDNMNPERRADFVLIVLKKPDGEVAGAMNASYIPARDQEGKDLGWSFVVVNYIVSEVKGAAMGLYAALDEKCGAIAASRGETVKYTVGETVPEVEGLVNKTGRARLYADKGGVMIEVPYFQAPLEWEEDGTPQTLPVPLHLMAKSSTNEKTISKEDLLRIVDGIFDYNSRGNAEDSCDEAGYAAACASVDETYHALGKKLEGVEKLHLITKMEREASIEEGTLFVRHSTESKPGLSKRFKDPAFLKQRPLPHGRTLSAAGTISDFGNEFFQLSYVGQVMESTGKGVAEVVESFIPGKHLRTFEERFPEEEYPGMLALQDPEDVATLNALAAEANLALAEQEVDPAKLQSVYDRAWVIFLKYRS